MRVSRGRSRVRRSRRSRRSRASTPAIRRKGFDEMISQGAPEGTDEELAGAQIEEFKLRAWVKYLSDDLLEGRGTGARGGLLAAKFIASEFESMGLEPAGRDKSYFQPVPMFSVKTDADTKLVVKAADDKREEFKFGEEFVASTDVEQPEIAINNDIVFVGYGVTAPELNWNGLRRAGCQKQDRHDDGQRSACARSRAEPVRRQGADLLRAVDLQI